MYYQLCCSNCLDGIDLFPSGVYTIITVDTGLCVHVCVIVCVSASVCT